MSAATFRRWGKLDQCLVSIEEAEVLDPENADVWVQLGLYHVSTSPPNYDAALPAFTKSLLLRPDHPPAVVSLAKLYISTGQVELAHTLLNQLTQDAAWDVPEAWYYLGKVCEAQERHERARECWIYALGLEESRPARRWGDAGDRWL
jgi:tetratricopeptide (TPR) repeat protein